MKIIVKVKANAKEEKVERVSQATLALFGQQKVYPPKLSNQYIDQKEDGNIKKVSADNGDLIIYKVSVKEPPVDGRANTAIIHALANYFNVPKSLITLTSGATSKNKIFDIDL